MRIPRLLGLGILGIFVGTGPMAGAQGVSQENFMSEEQVEFFRDIIKGVEAGKIVANPYSWEVASAVWSKADAHGAFEDYLENIVSKITEKNISSLPFWKMRVIIFPQLKMRQRLLLCS